MKSTRKYFSILLFLFLTVCLTVSAFAIDVSFEGVSDGGRINASGGSTKGQYYLADYLTADGATTGYRVSVIDANGNTLKISGKPSSINILRSYVYNQSGGLLNGNFARHDSGYSTPNYKTFTLGGAPANKVDWIKSAGNSSSYTIGTGTDYSLKGYYFVEYSPKNDPSWSAYYNTYGRAALGLNSNSGLSGSTYQTQLKDGTAPYYVGKNTNFTGYIPGPSGIGAFLSQEKNLLEFIRPLGYGSLASLGEGCKVVIEPLYTVHMGSGSGNASNVTAGYYELTATEIAAFGKLMWGGSATANTDTTAEFRYISDYTNIFFPGYLRVASGGVGIGAAPSLGGKRASFDTIIKNAYGMGVAFGDLNTYNITYNANGATSGSAPASQVKVHGTNITLRTNTGSLAKTGYSFAGWNTKSDGSGTSYSVGGTYTSNSAVTLYAKWTANTYAVSYNANGGSGAPSSQTKTYGVNLTLSSTKPTRTGYNFAGWNTASNGSGTSYSAGGTYTSNSAVTLYAQWTPINYYFDLNGVLNGVYGGDIAGFGTCDIYINGTLVANDVSDYWAAHPYGTTYEIKDIKAASGKVYNGVHSGSLSGTITQNTETVLSFGTNYYYFDLNGMLDGAVAYDIIGYGTCDIYINGTLVADDVNDYYSTLPYGTTYRIDDIKPAAGKRYNGVYSGSLTGTITANTETYLSFSSIIVNEIYHYRYTPGTGNNAPGGDWTLVQVDTLKGVIGDNVTIGPSLAISVPGHYYDSSYYTNKDGNRAYFDRNSSDSSVPQRSSNMLIHMFYYPSTYTITLDPNGGTVYGSDKPVPLTNPKTEFGSKTWNDVSHATRNGYTFEGWFTEKVGGTQVYRANGSSIRGTAYWDSKGCYCYAGDLTVYAHWEPISVTNHVYHYRYTPGTGNNAPGGDWTLVQVDTLKGVIGGNVTIGPSLAISVPGHSYDSGYYTNKDGNRAYFDRNSSDSSVSQADSDMWIHMFYYPTYTVSYNANGGTGSMSNSTATYGSGFRTRQNGFSRTGYTFVGWNEKADGSGVWWDIPGYSSGKANASGAGSSGVYESGKDWTWTYTNGIILYAQWVPNGYTVTYDANGGTGAPDDQFKSHGINLQLSSVVPVRHGYTFGCWKVETSEGPEYYHPGDIYTRNEPATLVALWQSGIEIVGVEPNAVYHVGQDVITTYIVYNHTDQDIVPDDGVKVRFSAAALGHSYNSQEITDIVIPAGDSNIYWFRWNVPEGIPSNVLCKGIAYDADGELLSNDTLNCTTGTVENYQTPDTQFERQKPISWVMPATPAATYTNASWYQWEYEDGAFTKQVYGVHLKGNIEIMPDASIGSSVNSGGIWTMRSGYGYTMSWNIEVEDVGTTHVIPSMVTPVQSAYALFPEFGYRQAVNQCRLLELVDGTWQFKENPYADDPAARLHFTPIWFPDGTQNYKAAGFASDCWTPAGMISLRGVSNGVTISGSLYDDWYIGRIPG